MSKECQAVLEGMDVIKKAFTAMVPVIEEAVDKSHLRSVIERYEALYVELGATLGRIMIQEA